MSLSSDGYTQLQTFLNATLLSYAWKWSRDVQVCCCIWRCSLFQSFVGIHAYCWHERNVGRERESNLLNMVVRDSLGAGVPWYVITQLKSCPVERLGQYLNGTCSHHTSLRFSSAQFSLVQLNSKQLPVSLSMTAMVVATAWVYESSCGHLGSLYEISTG